MIVQLEDLFMKIRLTAAAIALALAGSAFAADDYEFKNEIQARQSYMRILSFNLGLLGAMAKDEAPYDAKIATAAAGNLLAAAKMDNSAMWPAGSSADAPGLADKTRAKPEIWSTYPEVSEKHQALTDALTTMAAAAGDGLDAVKTNMGAVGKGCKGCHESFRVPKD